MTARYTVLGEVRWPTGTGDSLPALPGFIVSSFSPLVAELAERCLRRYFGARPADAEEARRTGIVVASTTGDIATAAAIARAVEAGRRVPPLLFYQSNPNAVAGYVAARWHLAGPVVCTMSASRGLADALDSACQVIEDGDADAVLVVVADTRPAAEDAGAALLVGPPSWAERHQKDI
jgi:3-oxoacyl-(acyl-carrier-protein) synthase